MLASGKSVSIGSSGVMACRAVLSSILGRPTCVGLTLNSTARAQRLILPHNHKQSIQIANWQTNTKHTKHMAHDTTKLQKWDAMHKQRHQKLE